MVVAGLREFFLLERAQEHARRLTGHRGERARALHRAGVARRECADELLGPALQPAAFVLYRDALRLLARARQLDEHVDVEEDEIASLSAVAVAIDALDEPLRTRLRAAFDRLGDHDPLAFDRLDDDAAVVAREEVADLFRWLEGSVDPRTVAKLRIMRALRLAGAVLAVLFLARAGIRKLIAPKDVALGKPVVASSHYAGTPDAGGLTDGDTRALGVHTLVESAPWVTVDLGKSYRVRTVRIHNRSDCCVDEGLGLVVEVGGPADPAPFVAQRNEHYEVWDIDAGGKEAQMITLRLPRNGYIALSELEVFTD